MNVSVFQITKDFLVMFNEKNTHLVRLPFFYSIKQRYINSIKHALETNFALQCSEVHLILQLGHLTI
jgi:hypothetical protein